MISKKTILSRSVIIKSIELNNINANLLKKLKMEIEGRSTKDGYILSINQIISKSIGKAIPSSTSGDILYNVRFECDLFNLENGDILIGCNVNRITQIGIFASYRDFVNILLITKYLPDGFMEKFKINDKIDVKVKMFNYYLTQEKIDLVGELYYYYIDDIKNRYFNLIKDDNNLPKFDIKYTDNIDSVPNELSLGYTKEYGDLLTSIIGVKQELWRFYSKFRNPYEELYKRYPIDYCILTDIFNLPEFVGKFSNCFVINETNGIDKKLKELKIKTAKSKTYDLVIANNGADFVDFSIDIEHYSMKGIFGDCFNGLSKLNKNGAFIIKVFNLYTYPMVQLVHILQTHFENSYLFKPETSGTNNSIRYLIFNGFHGIDKEVLDVLSSVSSNKSKYPQLLYPVEYIPELTRNWILGANIKFQKYHIRKINEIIDTIEFYEFKEPNKAVKDSYIEKQKIIANQWVQE